MYIREREDKIILSNSLIEEYDMKNIAFFDIETTGFDKNENNIVLISLGWFIGKNDFIVRQYFADTIFDEIKILNAFNKDLVNFNRWCSYNGKAFDEPFINRRMNKNNIVFSPPKEHLDLYRLIRPYHKQLGMERCNLKTVEKYLGINREDKIDGAISVQLYESYLINRDEKIREIIMLHNYEDVLNLPTIFTLIYDIDNNGELVREDRVTDKQLGYMKSLLKKNNLKINVNYDKISRKAASRIIDGLLKSGLSQDEVNDIIENSY